MFLNLIINRIGQTVMPVLLQFGQHTDRAILLIAEADGFPVRMFYLGQVIRNVPLGIRSRGIRIRRVGFCDSECVFYTVGIGYLGYAGGSSRNFYDRSLPRYYELLLQRVVDEFYMLPHEIGCIGLCLPFMVIQHLCIKCKGYVGCLGIWNAFETVVAITAAPTTFMISVHFIEASQAIGIHCTEIQTIVQELPVLFQRSRFRFGCLCCHYSACVQQPVQADPGRFLIHLYGSGLIVQSYGKSQFATFHFVDGNGNLGNTRIEADRNFSHLGKGGNFGRFDVDTLYGFCLSLQLQGTEQQGEP